MQNLDLFKAKLDTSQNIVITTHHKPDADALGSSLGMANYLVKKGHHVQVITPSDYPEFLKWMKGNQEVVVYSEERHEWVADQVSQADIIITLDFSVLSRINQMGEMVRVADGFKVNVDHHLDPEDFADFQFWNTKAAATCELCYELMVALGDEDLIDQDIANCLYAGIMTDTGGFRHSNTTKNVHEVVAKLIDLGADNSQVAKNIYDKSSLNRLRFLGFALGENLQVIEKYHTAYFALKNSDLAKFNSKTGDTEGLVNYALSIEGITLGALFKETDEGVKISLRSTGEFPANELASRFFNGGGHRNAAGGRVFDTLEDTVEKFKLILTEYKDQLAREVR